MNTASNNADDIDDRADDYLVARGDSFLDEDHEQQIRSELPEVDDASWTQFVRSMITAPLSAVSRSNALGLFEMTPRRLADLGMVKRLTRSRSDEGRTVWVAVFVPPLSCEKFLKNPQTQYRVFGKSMRDYANKLSSGEIDRDPRMSLSGALALLHRCGPQGLETWKSGEKFPATMMAYDRVAGIF